MPAVGGGFKTDRRKLRRMHNYSILSLIEEDPYVELEMMVAPKWDDFTDEFAWDPENSSREV